MSEENGETSCQDQEETPTASDEPTVEGNDDPGAAGNGPMRTNSSSNEGLKVASSSRPGASKEEKQPLKALKPKRPKGDHKYTFFVGPGNNSELVRATLERRPWWELGKEDDPELNLKWLQVRNRTAAEWVRRMGSQQFLNHLEGLNCIGRKNELYSNLKAYCDSQRTNVHDIAPPTFIVTVGDNCPEYAEFSRVCRQMEARSKPAPAAPKVKSTASIGGKSSISGSEAASDAGASAAATEEVDPEAADRAAAAGGGRRGGKAAVGSPPKRDAAVGKPPALVQQAGAHLAAALLQGVAAGPRRRGDPSAVARNQAGDS